MALRTGKVIIAKNIKLDKSYKDVLDYSEANMLSLVTANKVGEVSSASFVKIGENQIDTSFSYSDSLKCNYIAFQNPNYSNKWFFCFIDDVEYINNGTTRIHYIVDVFSTWYEYWQVNNCFVLREHVTDDTVGLHTVPENVELGEYVITNKTSESFNNSLKCVVASTVTPGELAELFGGKYNGIPSGVGYYKYDMDKIVGEVNTVQSFLDALASGQKLTAVTGIFLAPTWLTGTSTNIAIPNSNTVATQDFTSPRITALDTYVPKNKKLLTYPYCYINLSNNQGSNAILHQELWQDSNVSGYMTTTMMGALCPGCSIRAIPKNYRGVELPYDEGINLGKFPQVSWTTDQYTNWLTQNGVNIATKVASSAVAIGVGASTGNAMAVVGGTMSIVNSVNEVYKHSQVPPQAEGNLNSGDVTTSSGNNHFTIYNMTIKREYARIIDDFMNKYGYKINRIKTPNITGRTYWNYVQIGDSENIGYPTLTNKSVPAHDMELINNIFRQGVTIWHNHSNLGDYSLNNTIASNNS